MHVSQLRHPRRVLEELHSRAAKKTSMLYSDATELAIVQHDCDGRMRVGKIRCVENLEWAEVVGESEAEPSCAPPSAAPSRST